LPPSTESGISTGVDEVGRLRSVVKAMRELGVDEYSSARDGGTIQVKLGPAPSKLVQLREVIANASEPEEAAVAIEELKKEEAHAAEAAEREELEAMLASTPFAGDDQLISELMTKRA
jgi:hypothetical protein